MKKIVFVTGTRAEYGVMRALLKQLDEKEDIKLSVLATGMHLMEEYGNTVDEIVKDGFNIIAKIDMKLKNNDNATMSKGIAYGIIGMTDCFSEYEPDLVLIAGDRGEILAAAIAASHLNIPVAHISGGDTTTGVTIDERIRHATTLFSDIHFPANETSAKVIINMGENKDLVFAVGNPGVPTHYELSERDKDKLQKKYSLDKNKKLFLVMQHSVTSQPEKAEEQMKITMDALSELGEQSIVIYPNSDAASQDMISVIESYKGIANMQIFKSIPNEDFKKLLALSDVLIGNSSCALIEAPSFNLPCVNIGKRQEGRDHSNNIVDAKHDKKSIVTAVKKALDPAFLELVKKEQSVYVGEEPEQHIINIIENIDLKKVLQKKRNGPQ